MLRHFCLNCKCLLKHMTLLFQKKASTDDWKIVFKLLYRWKNGLTNDKIKQRERRAKVKLDKILI